MKETRLYTRTVIDHFRRPRNQRRMVSASGEGRAINKACSDVVRMFIRVEDQTLVEVSFQAQGCVACIAAASMTTELAKGASIGGPLPAVDAVVDALDGLPPSKVECSVIAPEALRGAILDFRAKEAARAAQGS